MKKGYLFLLFCLISFCALAQITRDLDRFAKLEVTDKINVRIIPSDFDKIEIKGVLADQVEIIQVSDVLRLKMTGSYILQGNKVDVILYTSNLSHVTARKGAQVVTFKQSLKSDVMSLSSSEGANIEIGVIAEHLNSSVTTGGMITIQGNVRSQDVDVTFGGQYEAKVLFSKRAEVKISGGGKATINVSDSFEGQTRAGGIIDVYGKPKHTKQSKFAGGKINYL